MVGVYSTLVNGPFLSTFEMVIVNFRGYPLSGLVGVHLFSISFLYPSWAVAKIITRPGIFLMREKGPPF
jgi:hypothetical protein